MEFRDALGDTPAAAGAPAQQGRDPIPLIAIGTLAVLAIVLVVGVLIGKSTGDGGGSAGPQIVTVGGGSGGAAANVANTPFQSDWPDGKTGYTIELGELSKDGAAAAQVDKAKADATKKGAKEVGALDSDDYGSLPGGNYVIYSGVYSSAAAAKKALGAVKKAFPDAKVVKVGDKSAGAAAAAGAGAKSVDRKNLGQLDNATGDDYVKRSRKLPSTTVLPGKAPPKDNKAPGGGSGGEDFE